MPITKTFLKVGTSLMLTAFAASNASAEMYIEGQLSMVDVKDVSTPVYSGSGGGFTFSNFKASVKYDDTTSLGVEAGYRFTPNFRAGLSYTAFSLDMKSINGSGTISDGTTTVDLSTSLTRGQLSGDSSFDNNVKLTMAQAYWDFQMDSAITPYVGIGLGQAKISNAGGTHGATSFTIGANYDINENNYLGVRYNMTKVDGPTDTLGITYQDIEANSIGITYGYRF